MKFLLIVLIVYIASCAQFTPKESMKKIITITKENPATLVDGLQIKLASWSTEETVPDPNEPNSMPQHGVNVFLEMKKGGESEQISLYRSYGENRYSPQVTWNEYRLSIIELKNVDDPNANLEAQIQIEKQALN